MSADELDRIEILMSADLEIEGRMPWSSNATFAVFVRSGDSEHRAIYKPIRGERPLWDFEPGLHRRERAAYVVSESLGIGAVPPTVIRDGPLGVGSVQWFVDADHSEHYFTIYESRDDLHDQLRGIAILDLAANNTDRKSGHCLLAHDHVWAIDNGLCFSADYKLRTVIWDFGGEPIAAQHREALANLADHPPEELDELLDRHEIEALRERCRLTAELGEFPIDETGHRYPWPLV
ncbi:MAG TPA: SCO1664 family protein [Acidimicrobiaceae bacterium]|nr:phosphatidylinositol kinase [Actinomycetota bacterium]MBS31778.1 phosphatidylinositol kinase [Acidimicrobiaceae bacterium]HAZ33470.1 SCO1664 family protein [Acidimicrobiaceae bacterium]|tara:strand:+ start:180 stop:884 length:705 start_codon:yes stop_codon:yes gene_type:complete